MGTGKQRRALLLVALAAVLANASWLSATAVVPALQRDWHLTSAGAAWLVIMVQIGFVTGSVAAALLNLPDRIEPRWLIAGSAVAAGVTNLGLLAASGLAVAQFLAAVTELAEPRYAGSVLALQLAAGFMLTIVSIRLVPLVVDAVGWRYALLPLAAGPLLGTVAMLRLRRLPAALGLANGKR
jgi:hypothetical protein